MSGQEFLNAFSSDHYSFLEFHMSSYDLFNNATSVTSSETGDTFPSSDSSEKVLGDAKQNKRKGPRGGVVHPFPTKLHQLLESHEFDDIISWQPNGRSFTLHDAQGFADSVMPKYFKQTKFRSFQRQLNLYDFKRIMSGSDKGEYYHPKFLQGQPELCKSMFRTRVKGHIQPEKHLINASDNDVQRRGHHLHFDDQSILQNTTLAPPQNTPNPHAVVESASNTVYLSFQQNDLQFSVPKHRWYSHHLVHQDDQSSLQNTTLAPPQNRPNPHAVVESASNTVYPSFQQNDLQFSVPKYQCYSSMKTHWEIDDDSDLSMDDIDPQDFDRSLINELKGIDEPIDSAYLQNFKW
jgi:hypothetical protein